MNHASNPVSPSPEATLVTLADKAGVPADLSRFKPGQLARILNVAHTTLRRLAAAGVIRATPVTPFRSQYLREDVLAYLASLQPVASTASANS